MVLEREILLLQCSTGASCLKNLSDQHYHWSLIRYFNLESAATYLDSSDASVGIIDCGGADEPTEELERFLGRYDGVCWVALLSRAQLSEKKWKLFVAAHCYDFHTTPVVEERLMITIGRAYGMNELKNMLCLPLQKGEVIGKHKSFKESLRKLYGCKGHCLTLSGEGGVGKRFLSERWAELHNFCLLDLDVISSDVAELISGKKIDFLINSNNDVCIFIKDVIELDESVQNKICELLSMGLHGCNFIFCCRLDVEDIDGCSSVIPELLIYLKKNWIRIPSLKERGQDRIILARYYLQKITQRWDKRILSFSADGEEAILQYGWPGNVAELIDRIMIGVSRCEQSYLNAELMGLNDGFILSGSHDLSLKMARGRAEKQAIKRVLNMVPGKTGRAAELLCISKSSLHRLIARYGIRR